VEEIIRLYGLFFQYWESFIREIDLGVEQGPVSITWEGVVDKQDNFLVEVELVSDEDHVPVDCFSIWIYHEQREFGPVICAEAGYMNDGDKVAGTSGRSCEQFLILSEQTWPNLRVLLSRVIESNGIVPLLEQEGMQVDRHWQGISLGSWRSY